MNTKIQFIHQLLHSKNTTSPQPFSKQEKYEPTPADLQEMNEQLQIALNPLALLDGLKNGTVTSKQVATAAVLNPAILGKIREELNNEAYSVKSDLNYQQRLSASNIMGQAMDQTLHAVPQLQQAFAPAQPQQQGPAPKLNTKNMPSAQATPAQRISK